MTVLQSGDRLVVSELSRLGRSLGQIVAILYALARTLGLSRSGCSRSEALSVHSCSMATQAPTASDGLTAPWPTGRRRLS